MLADGGGDGRYELARVFANKLAPSMGLVWHDRKLFAADPPYLVTFEDADGNGGADRRMVVLTGFPASQPWLRDVTVRAADSSPNLEPLPFDIMVPV